MYSKRMQQKKTTSEMKPGFYAIFYFSHAFESINDFVRQDIALFLEHAVLRSGFTEAHLLVMRKNQPVMHWSVTINPKTHNVKIEMGKPDAEDLARYVVPSEVTRKVLPVFPPPQGVEGTMEVSVLHCHEVSKAEKLLDRAILISYRVAGILKRFVLGKNQYFTKWKEMGLWMETAYIVSSSLDLRQMLHAIIQLNADSFVARSAIFMIDPKGNTLIPMIGAGSYDEESRRRFKALQGHKLFKGHAEAVNNLKPLLVTPEDARLYYPKQIDDFFKVKWAVIAPMVVREQVLGIIQVDRETNFKPKEIEMIFAIARQTAVAINSILLEERVQRAETTLETLLNGNFRIESKQLEGKLDEKSLILQLLSPRELIVLHLIVKSYSNKEISNEMNISVNTAKAHINNIYRKLLVKNRSEAILKAIQLGIKNLDDN